MTKANASPLAAAPVLATTTTAVLRRMERDYATIDTLSRRTVAAMYAVYAAHAIAIGWATRLRVWPIPLRHRPAKIAGAALVGAGASIALASALRFESIAQLSGTEPGALHTAGIYGWSRNPQYLGLGLTVTGIAIAVRSGFVGVLGAGAWAAYHRWIPAEEGHLVRLFGDEYREYMARVPRWVGFATKPVDSQSDYGLRSTRLIEST